MRRFPFAFAALALALGLAVPIAAAEYRYEVRTGSSSFANEGWYFTVDTAYSFPPDSSGPYGVLITAPYPPGTDSVYWRIPRSGIAGRTCKVCDNWLATIFAEQHGIQAGSALDADTVLALDSVRVYSKYSYAEGQSGLPFYNTTVKSLLGGVGAVYFLATRSTTKASWSYGFRLLEYNGRNIDSLWGTTLNAPVALAPRKAAPSPNLRGRTFDLHEMGVFLGRKSAPAAR